MSDEVLGAKKISLIMINETHFFHGKKFFGERNLIHYDKKSYRNRWKNLVKTISNK